MPVIARSRPLSRLPAGLPPLDFSLPLFSKAWIVVVNGAVYTSSAPSGAPPVDVQPDAYPTMFGLARGTASTRSQANRLTPMFANMPKTVLFTADTSDMRCSVGTTTAYWGMAAGGTGATALLNLGAGGLGLAGRRTATQTTSSTPGHACFQVGTFTGADWSLWVAGDSKALTYTGTASAYSAGSSYVETGWATYGAYYTQYTPLMVIAEADVPAMLARALSENPLRIFQPQRSIVILPAAGGSTFNVSITESIALADSPSAAMIAAATIAEAMAAADTITADMSASAAIAEALAVADTPSASMTAAGSVTESISASDAPSASMTAPASMSESIAASDTVSGAMSASASVSESITAADTVSGAVNAYAASVSESITAADTVTVAMSAAASVSESMTLLDAPGATMTATATISESISAADTVSGAVGVVSASIAEAISLSDAPSALMTASAAVAEAIAASDTASVVMSASRAVAEALSLVDTVLAGFPLSASVSESISLVDVVYGNLGTAILIDGRYIITGEPRRFTITGEPRQFRVTH